MQFIYPSFLWALAALAIPIIIHLFYFRRFKKVKFTNVRLLKEVKEETSSRNKLKDLLILLSRLLALAFLILAFAQPFIPRGETIKQGSNSVSVFVDNSFSMNAVRNQTPILDIALEKAREVIAAYAESDNFQILTHDFEGRHQRLVSKEDALELLEEIEITPVVRSLSSIRNRQKQTLDDGNANQIAYILSDFQNSIIDGPLPQDTTLETNLIPIRSVQENNVSIDSIWIEAGVVFPGQSNRLIVTLTNYGTETVENVRLSILKDGQEKPEGQLSIPASESITDTISLSISEGGWHTAQIKISDYPIQFDDTYYISFYVEEEVKVLTIQDGEENRYLNALLNGLSNFQLTSQPSSNINYGELPTYDLIIVHDVPRFSSGMVSSFSSYVQDGGKLILFPDRNAELETINLLMEQLRAEIFQEYTAEEKRVSRVNTDEFIFSDVFSGRMRDLTLPVTTGSYSFSSFQNRTQETLLRYRDGSEYLLKFQRENGMLYLCSAPLDAKINNLVLNAEIFVPMVYKMAIAKAIAEPLSYTIGGNRPIKFTRDITGTELVYTIKGATQFIPAQVNLGNSILLSDNGQVEEAGIYTLERDNRIEKIVAYNNDRKESDLTLGNLESFSENVNVIDQTLNADFTALISEKDRGLVLWKWCLIFALLFLMVETLLLRFWKK